MNGNINVFVLCEIELLCVCYKYVEAAVLCRVKVTLYIIGPYIFISFVHQLTECD
jgi:hypothetical protein